MKENFGQNLVYFSVHVYYYILQNENKRTSSNSILDKKSVEIMKCD